MSVKFHLNDNIFCFLLPKEIKQTNVSNGLTPEWGWKTSFKHLITHWTFWWRRTCEDVLKRYGSNTPWLTWLTLWGYLLEDLMSSGLWYWESWYTRIGGSSTFPTLQHCSGGEQETLLLSTQEQTVTHTQKCRAANQHMAQVQEALCICRGRFMCSVHCVCVCVCLHPSSAPTIVLKPPFKSARRRAREIILEMV